MFNVFSPTGLPGFRVRPQDDVPGFDIDENGLPRRERPWSDSMHPRSATPQYPDLAQAMMPTPSFADSTQPAPPQPPDWLYKLLTMPLPVSPGPFAPLNGPRPASYGTLFNPVTSFPATDQNVREMADTAPADIDGYGGGDAVESNAYSQPARPEGMADAWSWGADDGQPYTQPAVPSTHLSDAEVAQQATGAPPGLSVGAPVDPNFVLANANGDSVQEAQQAQPPGRSTPPPKGPMLPAQAKPGTRREMSGEDITRLAESRREQALNEAFLYKPRREERAPYWDSMLRRPAVTPSPGSKIQEPLPEDWRAVVRKINPSYVDYTEAAANKYGVPPELLGRLLYRESNYDTRQGVDRNGNPIPGRAVGIPQMYWRALKDVGLDLETFARAGAEAQIDAGAAYLARQYRRFGDWPRAVAAYHFGADRIEDWLAGKGPNYENIEQRKKAESANFRGKTGIAKEKEKVEHREAKARQRR